jgi:hypothetical protein
VRYHIPGAKRDEIPPLLLNSEVRYLNFIIKGECPEPPLYCNKPQCNSTARIISSPIDASFDSGGKALATFSSIPDIPVGIECPT